MLGAILVIHVLVAYYHVHLESDRIHFTAQYCNMLNVSLSPPPAPRAQC